jgi:hypothetical protein
MGNETHILLVDDHASNLGVSLGHYGMFFMCNQLLSFV